MPVYQIIEVANVHGGDIGYLENLISEYSAYENFGIKFQAFKYDEIAMEDYSYFDVYKQLFFNKDQWKNIISLANKTKDVWLDIFDSYGIEVLESNIDLIKGIKLQSSVLENEELKTKLHRLQINGKYIILNISGFSLHDIRLTLSNFQNILPGNEIALQVGFQAYPTEVSDSGLGKIKEIKEEFNCKVAFADHTSGTENAAIYLPILAAALGADFIEKHVMLDSPPAKFDAFSSLIPERFKTYIEEFNLFQSAQHQPFINSREIEYLKKTIQIPLAKENLQPGQLVSKEKHLTFKRTNQNGLSLSEINSRLKSNHILRREKEPGQAFFALDFKKAKIASIIACRMKSSRLPQKALLKIGDLSSVEFCIKNALKFQNTDITILATSTEPEDAILSDYTFSDDVLFFTGHPEDVIQRYLDVCNQEKIDIVVRITADMPFVSDDIFQILLRSHFEKGADYTTAKEAAIGTNLEIINVNALKKVKDHFPSAHLSEYMTWYFQNNKDHFSLNFVELPQKLIRDYRLTLDYEEDLKLFNIIDEKLNGHEVEYSLYDVFELLDSTPELEKINRGCVVKYKTDGELIERLNRYTKIGG